MAEEFADVMAILAEQDFGQNPGKAKGSRKKKFDKSHINEAKAELALELEKRVVNAKFDESSNCCPTGVGRPATKNNSCCLLRIMVRYYIRSTL